VVQAVPIVVKVAVAVFSTINTTYNDDCYFLLLDRLLF